jgi:hypothetical protein
MFLRILKSLGPHLLPHLLQGPRHFTLYLLFGYVGKRVPHLLDGFPQLGKPSVALDQPFKVTRAY